MSLSELRFTELLAAFRSSNPTPGGGSAAALAGAVGASLLAMVAGLPRPKTTSADEEARLSAAGGRAASIADQLAALMDRDSDAYELVVAAFRLPKSTDGEKAARSLQIQHALRAATEAPLEVMRACAAAIDQASAVASYGNINAASDVQTALELLGAGIRGAALNVEINLGSIKDSGYVTAAREESARLAAGAAAAIQAAAARSTGRRNA